MRAFLLLTLVISSVVCVVVWCGQRAGQDCLNLLAVAWMFKSILQGYRADEVNR